MGDLDPNRVKAAVQQGLALIEPLVIEIKKDQVTEAWNGFLRGSTASLLRGDISVDQWKADLGAFGIVFVKSVPASSVPVVVNATNGAAQIVEAAFTPPSNLTWLLFAGAGVMGLAYWWMKKQESQRQEVNVLPAADLFGTKRREKVSLPIADPEEEEAEFEEIT